MLKFIKVYGAVVGLFGKGEVKADESWGLDHGTWSVLRRMYPAADIPVIQLSLDRKKSPREHVEMAKLLLPLRAEGVLVIGSGNVLIYGKPTRKEDNHVKSNRSGAGNSKN